MESFGLYIPPVKEVDHLEYDHPPTYFTLRPVTGYKWVSENGRIPAQNNQQIAEVSVGRPIQRKMNIPAPAPVALTTKPNGIDRTGDNSPPKVPECVPLLEENIPPYAAGKDGSESRREIMQKVIGDYMRIYEEALSNGQRAHPFSVVSVRKRFVDQGHHQCSCNFEVLVKNAASFDHISDEMWRRFITEWRCFEEQLGFYVTRLLQQKQSAVKVIKQEVHLNVRPNGHHTSSNSDKDAAIHAILQAASPHVGGAPVARERQSTPALPSAPTTPAPSAQQPNTPSTAKKEDKGFKCLFPGCTWAFRTRYEITRHQKVHNKNGENHGTKYIGEPPRTDVRPMPPPTPSSMVFSSPVMSMHHAPVSTPVVHAAPIRNNEFMHYEDSCINFIQRGFD